MSTTDSILQAEKGATPDATNSNSSAMGDGQFLKGTWLDTLAKHRPDLQGTPEELLALRNDPALSKDMTAAYGADNQAILAKAGLPVTPGTTYLAHFAGPGGAVKVLQADPGASAGDILGEAAVKANPFLRGMTASGLQAWAAKKMGTAAPVAGVQPPPQQAQGAPPNPPPAPAAPAAAPPIFAGQPQQAASQADPTAFAAAPPLAPLFAPSRRPIDLSALRAALAAQAPRFAQS